jgi:hypothetical protein
MSLHVVGRPDVRSAAGPDLTINARLGGIFYLVWLAVSVAAAILLAPILSTANYVVSSGSDTRILVGSVLEIMNAFACIGTAVALYPITRRYNETLAIGFIAARVVEAALILMGVISILALVTLRHTYASSPNATLPNAGLLPLGESLTAMRSWTILLGPALMAGINAALLAPILFRAQLVPRLIPVLGMIGAPLLIASTVLTLLRRNEPVTIIDAIATAPIFTWELALGVWLTTRSVRLTPREHPKTDD